MKDPFRSTNAVSQQREDASVSFLATSPKPEGKSGPSGSFLATSPKREGKADPSGSFLATSPKREGKDSRMSLTRLSFPSRCGRGGEERAGVGLSACALLLTLLLSGCGNQMMRQPSFNPLDAPRSAPPVGAILLDPALTPTDGRPVASVNGGNNAGGGSEIVQTQFAEPVLPPPNLSDNARNEPTPKSVDAIHNPLPLRAQVISNGHTLFMNRCVQCHNPGGYGYGPVGSYLVPHPPDLATKLVQKNSDGAIFWHITMGQGKMPGFKTWTMPYQRWELTDYVRSLRNAPQLAQNSSPTLTAPYPVYGEPGFEVGRYTTAHKVVPANPQDQQQNRAAHFNQSSSGGWNSVR